MKHGTVNRSPVLAGGGENALGALPEWNLADLYPSIDSPQLTGDIARAAEMSIAFEKRWRGNLEAEALKGADGGLGVAIKEFEAIEELMGRIGSFAGLVYAGDTSDPQRVKLYGDVQEKLTDAGTHLIFFGLELNNIPDETLASALNTDPAFGHYRPWVEDLRKDKPHQLEDRVE